MDGKYHDRLREFVAGVFEDVEDSLTYHLDRINETIEVSYKCGYGDDYLYFRMNTLQKGEKIYFETTHNKWVDIEAWNAKAEMLMSLFLECCQTYDCKY
jgi:hypothetical protein